MWYSIEINEQKIIYMTKGAVLIKLPNKSKYKDFSFWYPKKLIKEGSNKAMIKLIYKDDFEFILRKKGNSIYKNTYIDKKTIGVKEFEEIYENMQSCIKEPSHESYLIVEEPKKIDIDVEVERSLLNE